MKGQISMIPKAPILESTEIERGKRWRMIFIQQ